MNALGPPSLPSTLPVDETLGALLGALDRVRLDYVAACSERSLSAWLADDGRTELERAQRALLEQIGAHVVDALRASPRRGTAPTPRAALTKPGAPTSVNTAAPVPSVPAPVDMATSTTNVAALDDADELWDPTIDVAEFADLEASDDRELLARQRADFEAAARALDEPLPWRETKVDVANGIVWGDVDDAYATHDPGDPPEWHDEVPVEDALPAERGDDAEVIMASSDWDAADDVETPPEIVAEAIADAVRPKVTPDTLQMLQQAMSAGRLLETAKVPVAVTEANRDADIVRDVLGQLGEPPGDLKTKAGARATELQRLKSAINQCEAWGRLPTKANFAVTATVVARLRALQALERDIVSPSDPVYGPLFRQLQTHTKETRPGVVHGLNTKHTPAHGSWHEDARRQARQARVVVGLPADDAESVKRSRIDDLLRRLESDARDDVFDTSTVAARIEEILDAGAPPTDTRLVNLATPWLALLQGHKRSKKLRRAIAGIQDANDRA